MNIVPARAQVVVVGGGIIGCSIAYHLTQLGMRDVLLLERHQLTSGTTWHAAGLVAQLRSTQNQTRLARYSHELYQRLEGETGQATGFRRPGSISLSTTPERWEELRRNAVMARRLGIDATEIGSSEIRQRFPLAFVDDVIGGIWLPEDSSVSPSDCTMALAKGARQGGASLLEGQAVDDLLTQDGRCTGVVLSDGRQVEAETVVLACGLWTRQLAAKAGVRVPLMAAEHHYVVTEPVPGVDSNGPVLRDPDRWSYLKPEAGGSLLVGLFEPVAKPWPSAGPPPTKRPFVRIESDLDHIGTWLEPALDRVRDLRDVGLRMIFTGPESFTPDDAYILGEAPTLDSLFVAAGFNSIGIQSAGGVGMAMASWIADRRAPMDLADVDIRRFEDAQGTEAYLRNRTVETLGLLYAPHGPHRQYQTARGVRRSALHDRLTQAGACFGELNGWERPLFFARPDLGVNAAWTDSWGQPRWHAAHAAEHTAVRERVGMFDQTSFSKFCVQGTQAAAVLDRLSAGAVIGEIGRCVYTQWCNAHGGIEADLSVIRLAADEFWVIGNAATRLRDLTSIQRAIREFTHGGAAATVTDITSAYTCLTVAGPRSRELLSALTSADLSEDAFPYATSREIELHMALVRANRMSYVGELGWELYVPTESATYLFDEIRAAGNDYGLALCGFMALDSLRLEVGNRHWGHDIGPDDTPVEAGLRFAVAWDKPSDFLGRAALQKQAVDGVSRRLVQIAVHDQHVRLHRDESLWRNGQLVGHTTSGGRGHTVGAALAIGWVEPGETIDRAWIDAGTWEVEVSGTKHPAAVQLGPWRESRVRAS